MKIIVFHEYNDFSGSPSVLRTVLEGLLQRGHEVTLVTSRGGVLDDLEHYPNLQIRHVWYRFSRYKFISGLRTLRAQARAFAIGLREGRDRVFYANTVLSFGGALAAKCLGRPLIYHYHENAYKKNWFYRRCADLMQRVATRIVCVSRYQRESLRRQQGVVVVPNAVPRWFDAGARRDSEAAFRRRTVLMATSLKDYKGVPMFAEMARRMPDVRFNLVLNAPDESIRDYFADTPRSENLHINGRSERVVEHYNEASVVVNLSNPNVVIESFGMTAIEAFACGLPVVVPDVGGIAELVTDGENGYKTDVRDATRVADCLSRLLDDASHYSHCACGAQAAALRYDADRQVDAIESIILDSQA